MSDDLAIRIRINGEVLAVDPRGVSRAVALECLQDCGLSHEQAIASLFLQPGKIALSAFVWLARRQAGVPRIQRNGRVTARLIDTIWDELDAFDDEIEVLDDQSAVTPDPGT